MVATWAEKQLQNAQRQNALMIRAAVQSGPCRCGEKKTVRFIAGPEGGVRGGKTVLYCERKRWFNFWRHDRSRVVLQY